MRYIPTINAQHRYVHNTLQDSDRDLAIKDPIIFFQGEIRSLLNTSGSSTLPYWQHMENLLLGKQLKTLLHQYFFYNLALAIHIRWCAFKPHTYFLAPIHVNSGLNCPWTVLESLYNCTLYMRNKGETVSTERARSVKKNWQKKDNICKLFLRRKGTKKYLNGMRRWLWWFVLVYCLISTVSGT